LDRWLRGEATTVRPSRRGHRQARRLAVAALFVAAFALLALTGWLDADPPQATDAVERPEDVLLAGKPLVLIGGRGGPASLRWRLGKQASQAHVTKERLF